MFADEKYWNDEFKEDFLHDFFNTTILHIGMDNGCGTIDEELYKFIVRGSADYLIDEQNWTIDDAKDFLKAIAIHIHQTTTDYIQKNGCDMFNFVVIENIYDITYWWYIYKSFISFQLCGYSGAPSIRH